MLEPASKPEVNHPSDYPLCPDWAPLSTPSSHRFTGEFSLRLLAFRDGLVSKKHQRIMPVRRCRTLGWRTLIAPGSRFPLGFPCDLARSILGTFPRLLSSTRRSEIIRERNLPMTERLPM